MRVAFEAFRHLSLVFDQSIQFGFGNVTERRMTEVVRKTGCFDDIGIEPPECVNSRLILCVAEQVFRQATPDLGNLKGMSQPVVDRVAIIGRSDLSDASQAAEGR